MRWAAIAVSPLVRLGDNQLPRLLSRAVPSKRVRASMSSSTTTAAARTAVDVVGVRNEMAWEGTELCVAHFNAAGDSPMPRTVLERVQTHMQMEATLGGYEAAANVQDELEAVYNSAAKLINAQPDEIALQESASMAWARAFYALAQGLSPGDRIVTGMVEYGANYVAMLQACKRTGAVVEVIPSNESGELDVVALEEILAGGEVKAVAITHVPTNGGVVNPAKAVGEVCRRFGVLYILDACQSVGQLQVDVEDIGCQVLCATGRKFLRGPRGTGFLYISREAMATIGEPPMIDHYAAPWVETARYELRPDARRFEFWESNVAGRLGLGVAIRYAMDIGMELIEDRIRQLAGSLRERLENEPAVSLMDLGRVENQCGIVSFAVPGVDPSDIKQGLRLKRVFVSTSSAGSTPLDAEDRALPTVVRASVHYFNNEADLDRFMLVLHDVIQDAPR
ncbi:unnamed protein product [Ectocarpus sp. 4 AP-2014]